MSVQSNPEFMNPNYKEEPQKQEKNVSEQDSKNLNTTEDKKIDNSDNLSKNDSNFSEQNIENDKPSNLDDHTAYAANQDQKKELTEEESAEEAKNWKAFRELKKKAEMERDEALRRYRELETERNKKFNKNTHEEFSDEDLKFDPDDFAEGKHLNKVVNKIKKMEQQLNNYNQQSAMLKTEAKIKSKYNDFDDVVTRENLEILSAREPEIAQGLNANPDLYSKAITAYTMIKNLKIYSPDKIRHSKEQQIINKKIDENLNKPRVAASVAPQESDSPLSHANRFSEKMTEEERLRIYKQMQERANG